MPFKLTWLPTVLKNAGLKVAEHPGWMNRGHGDVGTIKGVMCHHTAGAKNGIMPSHNFIITGSTKLPGPLAQLGLGRDGTFFVIAAGKCFHAGKGKWEGLTDGNGNFIGIEAENTGGTHNPPRPKNPPSRPQADPPFDLPWPDVQMDAYRRGVAAILQHIGQKAIMCCGHKEYAIPVGRKTDPSFDMDDFRTDVAAIMNGTATKSVLIPNKTPDGRPTLRRPSKGDTVKEVQKKIGFVGDAVDGNFGPLTEVAVRRFQRDHGLVPDGIVGPKTWAAFDGE